MFRSNLYVSKYVLNLKIIGLFIKLAGSQKFVYWIITSDSRVGMKNETL